MAESMATVAGGERIGDAFASAREQGRAALMPYLMGAYPDAAGWVAVAEAYADAGADLIELGIPFSDPLADGPVIHAAATAALAGPLRERLAGHGVVLAPLHLAVAARLRGGSAYRPPSREPAA